ncbi:MULTISPECIES: RNA polymerase sigma factor [Sphingobacterium]|uniref:RNA polymerase sigma factor n=1 Tax=Sphingobacterium TaxID=28453 RepID=UPI002579663E|nr:MULTISPECIES: sigma factor [Sphingobacterium]
MKTIGDKEIWDEIKKGNVSAFEELYYRYANKLLKEVSCRIFDENTVEDLIQDIFLSLWEKRENYQVRGAIYPYLHGMAINRVLNFYRQHKLTPKFVEIWEQISRDKIQLEDYHKWRYNSSTALPVSFVLLLQFLK